MKGRKNLVAKAATKLKTKVVPSGKAYKRKPKKGK